MKKAFNIPKLDFRVKVISTSNGMEGLNLTRLVVHGISDGQSKVAICNYSRFDQAGNLPHVQYLVL